MEPDREAARAYCRKFDLQDVAIFDRLEGLMAADLGLKGAIVANPPHVHADAACALLDAGIPIDNCPIEPECNFSAYRFYPELKGANCALPRRRSRCVFNNDSDLVDHQSAVLEYESGVTAAFSLMSLGATNNRECRICGSEATLVADLEAEQIRLHPYHETPVVLDRIDVDADGHAGADEPIIAAFFDYLDDPARTPKTTVAEGWEAMVTAVAIDRARIERRVVEVGEMKQAAPRL